MAAEKGVVDRFIKLGLSQYESNVLVSVFSLGKAKATEISSYSGVPKAKIYDVLDSLCNKRLIRMHATKPMTYSPIEPEKLFEALEEWENAKLDEKKKEINNFKKDSMDDLDRLFEKSKSSQAHQELVEIIKLGEPSHLETKNIIKRAKKELFFMTEAFEFLETVEDALDDAIKRKVDVKIIMAAEKLIKKENLGRYQKVVERLKDKKVKLRFSDELFHLRYCLNDPDDKGNCGCVLVVKEYDVPKDMRNAVFSRNFSFVKGLRSHFSYFWK